MKSINRLVFAALLLYPVMASAYVGPGAGLGAIGTVLALIGAVLLGIVGFIWYPVKKLIGGKKSSKQQKESGADSVDSPQEKSESDGKPAR